MVRGEPNRFNARLRKSSAALRSRVFVTIDFQYLTFMIHGPPETTSLAIDPDENLIDVPPRLDVRTSRSQLQFSKFGGEDGSEAVPPEPDSLMADVYAPFVQQVFDLA